MMSNFFCYELLLKSSCLYTTPQIKRVNNSTDIFSAVF